MNEKAVELHIKSKKGKQRHSDKMKTESKHDYIYYSK